MSDSSETKIDNIVTALYQQELGEARRKSRKSKRKSQLKKKSAVSENAEPIEPLKPVPRLLVKPERASDPR